MLVDDICIRRLFRGLSYRCILIFFSASFGNLFPRGNLLIRFSSGSEWTFGGFAFIPFPVDIRLPRKEIRAFEELIRGGGIGVSI